MKTNQNQKFTTKSLKKGVNTENRYARSRYESLLDDLRKCDSACVILNSTEQWELVYEVEQRQRELIVQLLRWIDEYPDFLTPVTESYLKHLVYVLGE